MLVNTSPGLSKFMEDPGKIFFVSHFIWWIFSAAQRVSWWHLVLCHFTVGFQKCISILPVYVCLVWHTLYMYSTEFCTWKLPNIFLGTKNPFTSSQPGSLRLFLQRYNSCPGGMEGEGERHFHLTTSKCIN